MFMMASIEHLGLFLVEMAKIAPSENVCSSNCHSRGYRRISYVTSLPAATMRPDHLETFIFIPPHLLCVFYVCYR